MFRTPGTLSFYQLSIRIPDCFQVMVIGNSDITKKEMLSTNRPSATSQCNGERAGIISERIDGREDAGNATGPAQGHSKECCQAF